VSRRPVVVLTNERDLAADNVIRHIARRNVPIVRLNIEHATSSSVWPWRPAGIHGVEPGAVWWRQFELPRGDIQDIALFDDLLVVRAQWRAWAACLYDSKVPWINDLWAARRSENKIEQLRIAHQVGFSVPETLVTNDLAEASSLGHENSLVVKTVASAYFELSDEAFVYTRTLSDQVFQDSTLWNNQPLVVQRKIDGLDVRVIMVEEQCFGASCKSDLSDWRLAAATTEWAPWPIPTRIAERCRSYMSIFGLRYAAFDFIDDGKNVWFLEANQAGEWTFMDRPLSLGIAESLASSLVRLTVQE
jgi:hypothetical protein